MSTTIAASAPGTMRLGLCIDMPSLKNSSGSSDLPYRPPATGHQTHRASVASLFPEVLSSVEQPVVMRARSDDRHSAFRGPQPTSKLALSLRSVTGMQGLLLAENGGGLVELDPLGRGSGFKQGTQVVPGLVTPRGGVFGVVPPSAHHPDVHERVIPGNSSNQQRLSRHGTLLSQGATPARNAAELKSLLGNSRSKVKSGAKVFPPANLHVDIDPAAVDAPAVALEQGKSRARVEVDILLDSEICVEGCYLTGKLHIKVKRRGTKDSPVFLAGGKMRVVGFEGIPDNNDRHTFYQHVAPLSAISSSSHVLYASPPDEEGFSRAREGMHAVPFAMKLPVSDGIHVGAKGPFDNRSGIIVKYIVIASFKLKDSTMSKRSIAHFYRSCEVYPYLNASIVMAPATHPLLSTAARSLFLGGAGKLKLTASLHRNFWVAGQRCCVGIAVHNESKKTVKGLILSLIRTTTVFHPHPDLDVASPNSADPDACQTTTTRKLVAETNLEAGQRGLNGHVTAKGWWAGVEPGARMNFAHFILLPPNALSIVRSRLLEVQYAIRVSLVAGSLSSELSVMLPVRIVNHLSIDPPPSYPTPFDQPGIPAPVLPLPIPSSDSIASTPPAPSQGTSTHSDNKRRRSEGGRLASIFHGSDTRDLGSLSGASVMPHQAVFSGPGSLPSCMPMPRLAEEGPGSEPSSIVSEGLHELPEERPELQEDREEDNEQDYYEHEGDDTMRLDQDRVDDLENLSMTDSDEEIEFVVELARLEDDGQSATRFADLHIGGEQKAHEIGQGHMESTVSSRNTNSIPSAGDDQHEEPVLGGPSQQVMRERLIPVVHSRPRLRSKTPDLGRDLSDSYVIPPRPSPPGSKAAFTISSENKMEHTKAGGFPLPQKSMNSSPFQRSPFSQRVDRLVAARRAAAKAPIFGMTSDSSDGDRTFELSTERIGTHTETSSSEMSPVASQTPMGPTVTLHHLRKYTASPSKMPVPQLTSASPTANSVRSRVAELEGICKVLSAEASLSNGDNERWHGGDHKLSYKAPPLRHAANDL